MTKPKNLAQLKKYLKVGMKFRKVTDGIEQYREISDIQTNGVWFKRGEDGKKSWFEYPRAREFDFTEEYFQIYSHSKYYYL